MFPRYWTVNNSMIFIGYVTVLNVTHSFVEQIKQKMIFSTSIRKCYDVFIRNIYAHRTYIIQQPFIHKLKAAINFFKSNFQVDIMPRAFDTIVLF